MRFRYEKLLLLTLFTLLPQIILASPVWRVSNGENTLYLGGSVHMLRATDYPLPETFEVAYLAADSLVFETDIGAMQQPSAQMDMLQQLMYTDGRTLQSVLSPEAYAALTGHVTELGLPMMMLQNMKPGMLMSTLEIIAFQQLGFTPQGVDMHFYQRAVADGKSTGYLETVGQQVAFVAGMGEGEESEFVLMSLSELDEIATDIETVITTWRTGDVAAMQQRFVDELRESAPDSYELLLAGRNAAWLPQLEAMLDDPDTEFVLVGVAHLLGDDGLVELLAARDYRLEQL